MSENKVFVLKAWDEEDDCEDVQVAVFKNRTSAETAAESWKSHGWDNAIILERKVEE